MKHQEHPFSNGESSEKRGIEEASWKLDLESLVELTTSCSPCRAMIVVCTFHGPLRLSPTFSAWIETSCRVPSSFTLHTTGLWRTESNPPPRIAGPGSTYGGSAGSAITSWSRPSPSKSAAANTYAHSPPWQSVKGCSNVCSDPNRMSSSCDDKCSNTSPSRSHETRPETTSTNSASSAAPSPSKSPEVVAWEHREITTAPFGEPACSVTHGSTLSAV